jgi:peptide/nickel transport system substrate-binding protein
LITRRQVLRAGLALAALPLVAACAQPAAPAPTAAPAKPAAAAPAKPGGSGTLKMLLWQAPTILNPHLSTGTKDYIAARVSAEPLMTVDNDGKFTPVLAAEVPSTQNGGVAADGKSVTYKLKQGIKWSDGQPFSAEDVVFTWEWITTKESGAITLGSYTSIDKVEAPDPNTVKISFKEPTGGWFVPFVGYTGMIIPKHIMKDFVGAKAREAPINTKLVGTGPYFVDDFKPGDLVIYKANPHYRDADKVGFERIEMKGGGDPTTAARAVFQTGEYDYSWNLQVEAQVLQDIMSGGKGDLLNPGGSGVEQFFFNLTDPNKEVNGERSSPTTKHPFLTDIKVREAMTLAVDRQTIVKQLYGDGLTGQLTNNILTVPSSLASKNTTSEFSIEKANKILDDAGYKKGGDGIRMTPEGVRMKVVLVTSINSLRQKEQAIIKDGWAKIGVETELKSVDAGVYFSSDPNNPDTYPHFYADVLILSSSPDSGFPVQYMGRFYTGKDQDRNWAQKANNWAGRNFMKWKSEEYDKLYDQVLVEPNLDKAATMWQQLNELVIKNFISVPLVDRTFSSGKAKGLTGPSLRTFDSESWNIGEWKKG